MTTTDTVSIEPRTREPEPATPTSPQGGLAQAVRELADAIGEDPARIRDRLLLPDHGSPESVTASLGPSSEPDCRW